MQAPAPCDHNIGENVPGRVIVMGHPRRIIVVDRLVLAEPDAKQVGEFVKLLDNRNSAEIHRRKAQLLRALRRELRRLERVVTNLHELDLAAEPQQPFLDLVDEEPHRTLRAFYKRLIALRKQYKVFGRGTIEFLEPENHRVVAHVRRHDWLVQMCAEAIRAVLWFNPLVWIACARLRRESEQACDDEVLGLGVGGRTYAAHLLELARQCRRPGSAWAAALPMAHPSTLERRIVAMLNPRLDRRVPSRRVLAALGTALLLVTVPIAAGASLVWMTVVMRSILAQ